MGLQHRTNSSYAPRRQGALAGPPHEPRACETRADGNRVESSPYSGYGYPPRSPTIAFQNPARHGISSELRPTTLRAPQRYLFAGPSQPLQEGSTYQSIHPPEHLRETP